MYTVETSCKKGTSVHIKTMCINQLHSSKIGVDFAKAYFSGPQLRNGPLVSSSD